MTHEVGHNGTVSKEVNQDVTAEPLPIPLHGGRPARLTTRADLHCLDCMHVRRRRKGKSRKGKYDETKAMGSINRREKKNSVKMFE